MRTNELTWKTRDGLDIHGIAWEPETKPRAVVGLVHGLGEHAGRFQHVGKALAAAGYALLGSDLRGHGKSGGRRGHAPSYESYMEDIDLLLEQASARYPGLPQFLYGHSLGGSQVINYALRRKPDLAGVIASSPLLRLHFRPPAYKVLLGRLTLPILPGFNQPTGLERAALSRDPAIEKAYLQDPLVHDRVTGAAYFGFMDAGEWAIGQAAEFPLPLLLMHGTADRLASVDASQEFARHAGRHVILHLWEGGYHELHNDLEKEEVLQMIIIWMDARLSA
jgi:alpha-beta hydrolase superfamily lysophospholipase